MKTYAPQSKSSWQSSSASVRSHSVESRPTHTPHINPESTALEGESKLATPAKPWGSMISNVMQTAWPSGSGQIQRHVGHHDDEQQTLQAKASTSSRFEVTGALEQRIQASRGHGQPLDLAVRGFMEPRFGASFAHVTVHTDSDAIQMNRDLQAQAFTQGSDIYFNQGKYNPHSTSGKQLLAHELTHTIQQTGGTALQTPPTDLKATLQPKTEPGAHDQSCGCTVCAGKTIQRQIDSQNPSANLLGPSLLQQISTVSPSPVQRHSDHNQGCHCSLCRGGQAKLTVGATGDRYEQEADRMAAKVIGMPDLASSKKQPSQHPNGANPNPDITQTGASPQGLTLSSPGDVVAQRQPLAHQVTTTSKGVIQRHSSHEHYLLGESSPDELAQLSVMREWGRLKKKGASLSPQEILQFNTQYEPIKHTIEQHLTLLANFINNPEYLQDKENRRATKNPDDTTTLNPGEIYHPEEAQDWQVPYIELPVKEEEGAEPGSSSVIVMYGELNALPDFFGNPSDIANTPKRKVLGLVQGIRQRVYKNLLHWYNDEIAQPNTNQLKDQTTELSQEQDIYAKKTAKRKAANIIVRTTTFGIKGVDTVKHRNQTDFMWAKGPMYADKTVGNEEYFADVKKRSGGENSLMTELGANQASSVDKESDEAYFAALERNACHFAPYSWDAWKKYHEQALKLAGEAHQHRKKAEKIEENPFLQFFNKGADLKTSQSNPSPEQDDSKKQNKWVEFDDFSNGTQKANDNVVKRQDALNPFLNQTSDTNPFDINPFDIDPFDIDHEESNNYSQATEIETEKESARKKTNEAVLLNAFGEHFLQDSYAAGHLVDKTVIMQKFALWLHQEEQLKGLMPEDRSLMINMVSQKDLTLEPQEFQNKLQNNAYFQDASKGGPYTQAATDMGLPPDQPIIFLMWWRHNASNPQSKLAKEATPLDLLIAFRQYTSNTPGSATELESQILEPLVNLGFIKKDKHQRQKTKAVTKYSINQALIRQITGNALTGKMLPSYVSQVAVNTPTNYKELAAEFNVQAYITFMERTVIQTISNHFHDIYCRKGLEVSSRGDEHIGLIYGDKDMLSKNAAPGVKYAAETGRLSRNAVIKTAQQGIDSLTETEKTASIEQRFPGQVKVNHVRYSLKDWNTEILAQNSNFQNAWDQNPKIQQLKKAKNLGIGRMNQGNLFADLEEKPKHPNHPF